MPPSESGDAFANLEARIAALQGIGTEEAQALVRDLRTEWLLLRLSDDVAGLTLRIQALEGQRSGKDKNDRARFLDPGVTLPSWMMKAAVVGVLALLGLLRLLRSAQFHHFAWYCALVGLAALLFG